MSGGDYGYDYLNARLRAMRSRLLPALSYERLLAATDIPALIAGLDQTGYHEALQGSLAVYAGQAAVLRALQLDHSATLRRIGGYCGGTTAAAYALQLAPYVRHNIIALLRGVAGRAEPARLFLALILVPPFKEGILAELARQPNVRSLCDLLVQWNLPSSALAKALAGHLAADHEAASLEMAFDVEWAKITLLQTADLPETDNVLVSMNFARYLDLHNLLLALDLRSIRLGRPAPWLPGGRLQEESLEGLRTADSSASMAEALASAPAGAFWLPALEAWEDQRPASLQDAWERSLLIWRIGLFGSADPLGPGILIAYLAAKETEVRNLRLITKAVAGDIEREEASQRLVFVDI